MYYTDRLADSIDALLDEEELTYDLLVGAKQMLKLRLEKDLPGRQRIKVKFVLGKTEDRINHAKFVTKALVS